MPDRYRYEAVAARLEKDIISGKYKPGQKLPSVRELQQQLNASMATITLAYELLGNSGRVQSRPRSGYYVSAVYGGAAVLPDKEPIRPVVHNAAFAHHQAATMAGYNNPLEQADFNVAAPGNHYIPQKLLLRTMQQVIREKGMGLLQYYPPNGLPRLKQQVAAHAARYNGPQQAEQLVITDGVLQALYIALAAVAQPGDIIAVESPCVYSVLQLLQVLQLRMVEIPVAPGTGLDVDQFRKVCARQRIRAVVLTPNFHNPTGAVMPEAQKRALLAEAEHRHIAIIENDVYGDLHYGGERPQNIRAWDKEGLVLTASSCSKTLASGIRLGWLWPGKFFAQAERIKFAMGRSVSPLYQELVQRLLASGSYDRHVRRFRMQLSRQACRTAQLLEQHFPRGTRFTRPAGGYSMWVQLPPGTDTAAFYRYCTASGILFTPGYCFSLAQRYRPYFRLVYTEQYTRKREAALKQAGAAAAGRLL